MKDIKEDYRVWYVSFLIRKYNQERERQAKRERANASSKIAQINY